MTTGTWDLRTTVGGAFPIKVDGVLALTLGAAGAVAVAGILTAASLSVTTTLGVTGNATFSGTITANKAYGVAPAGASTANTFIATLSGDPGGTTDAKVTSSSITVTGANSLASVIGANNAVTLSHSAGTVANANIYSGTITNTGNGAVTTSRAIDFRTVLSTGSGAFTTLQLFYGKASRSSGTGTATTVSVFYAADSGGVYATNAIGFDSEAMSGAGTLTANFRAANSANTGRYAFLSTGTAISSFGGTVVTVASSTSFAGLNIPHGAAPTSPINGDIWSTTTTLNFRLNGVTKSITMT